MDPAEDCAAQLVAVHSADRGGEQDLRANKLKSQFKQRANVVLDQELLAQLVFFK